MLALISLSTRYTKFKDRSFNNTNDCNLGNTQKLGKNLFKFGIPCIRKPSTRFLKKFESFNKNKFNVDLNIYFKFFKVIGK